jgi:hypothetical protein
LSYDRRTIASLSTVPEVLVRIRGEVHGDHEIRPL